MSEVLSRRDIGACVRRAVDAAEVIDIHTHLLAPQFGDRFRWGIDEMLVSPEVVAEFFRVAGHEIDHARFWSRTRKEQAVLIWDRLFVRRSPISEACRGIVSSLRSLGMDPAEGSLGMHRYHFSRLDLQSHVDNVLKLAGVRRIVTTNDPLEPAVTDRHTERDAWLAGKPLHDHFRASLRLDRLVHLSDESAATLMEMGYHVQTDLSGKTCDEARRFLDDWIERMHPEYMAVSLPAGFRFPGESIAARLIENCILPAAADHGLPLALMLGTEPLLNLQHNHTGDPVRRIDLSAIHHLCCAYSKNRFLVFAIPREDQHELIALAREFHNLHLVGTSWLLDGPSQAEEVARLRLELLGHTFTPYYSDACVLEQLIGKWHGARAMVARLLAEKYAALIEAGWSLSEDVLRTEVSDFMSHSALRFIRGKRQL